MPYASAAGHAALSGNVGRFTPRPFINKRLLILTLPDGAEGHALSDMSKQAPQT